MSLRLGIDLDGTLADLSSVYHEYEASLFGAATDDDALALEVAETTPSGKQKLKAARKRSRRQEGVWRAIRNTPDFWTSLKPLEPDVLRHLHSVAVQFNWEVFFITQRPKTAGASVQRQTQQWLSAHGFPTPSVLTLSGSRGKAAHVLDLDFLIDDLPKNCVDAISDSKCRPILVVRHADPKVEDTARHMNIGVVRSVAEAISLLTHPAPEVRETAVGRILKVLGLTR